MLFERRHTVHRYGRVDNSDETIQALITGTDGTYIIIHLSLKIITKAKRRKEKFFLFKISVFFVVVCPSLIRKE